MRKTDIEDPALELARVKKAKALAIEQLTEIHDKALKEVGKRCVPLI